MDDMCPMNNVKNVNTELKSVANMVQQEESSSSSSSDNIIDLDSSDDYAYVVFEQETINVNEENELELFLVHIAHLTSKNNPAIWADVVQRKFGEIDINTVDELLRNILSLNYKLWRNGELPMFNGTTKLMTKMATLKLLNNKTISLNELLNHVASCIYRDQHTEDTFITTYERNL